MTRLLPFLFIILMSLTESSLANFHVGHLQRLSFQQAPSLQVAEQQVSMNKEPRSEFSIKLQERILQILAHQLLDEKAEELMNDVYTLDTEYYTGTFSVNISTMNPELVVVSIKDILQRKETLLEIPR